MAQPEKRHANRIASVLEWYDRHRVYNNWFKRKKRTNKNGLKSVRFVHKRRPQSGGRRVCSVRTFFGQGRVGSSDADVPTF